MQLLLYINLGNKKLITKQMLPFLTFCCQCVLLWWVFVTHTWKFLSLHCGAVREELTRCLKRLIPTTCFCISPLFQAVQSIELLWNVCGMTSACFFSHPVAHCVCLLPKPGPLEAILLLFAWRQSHASRWVFFMSCFWTENTWTRRLWIPHCLTEQRVQLRQGAHVHLLSVEGWGYILSVYSQNGCIFSWWNEE